jgi:hypothetical protein
LCQATWSMKFRLRDDISSLLSPSFAIPLAQRMQGCLTEK